MVGFALQDTLAQEVNLEQSDAGITLVSVLFANTPQEELSESSLKVRLKGNHQPILGDFLVENNSISFKPYWALDKKLTYEVFWNDQLVKVILPNDSKNTPPTKVLTVYPTINVLPENLLKFYIHFSNKMSEAQSAKYITLLKNGKDTVRRAFLDLQPELWDKDNSLLTIWIEPGRLKRDLGPNRILGPTLEAGNDYSLIISKEWKNQKGMALVHDYVKRFEVIEADREYPKIKNWDIDIPKSHSNQPLNINFNEPLDYILAGEVIDIIGERKWMTGQINVFPDGRQWSFIPDEMWLPGNYTIRVKTKLEDLAGNNLNRLFDTDLMDKSQRNKKSKEFELLNFVIK